MSNDKGTVLVVDDHIQSVELLECILQDNGYKYISVYSAEEAWEILRERKEDIKVILLDRMMPGMSGTDLLKLIRDDEQLEEIQVILQTALARDIDIAEGTDAGANKYVSKPYDEKLLLSMLNACIKEYDKIHRLKEMARK